MLEMLKERKAALEAQGKKGFTLMEMLIVIAIIAVLIAIAIPIFTAQLERAREATDAANIRSAYAEVTAQALTNQGAPAAITKDVKLEQQQSGWQNKFDFPANLTAGSTEPAAGGTATLTYATDGTISINIKLTQG